MAIMQHTLIALELNSFQKTKKVTDNKNIMTNIWRFHTYVLIICGYFCIGFMSFMMKVKSLLDYNNSFSPSEYEEDDKMSLKFFQ